MDFCEEKEPKTISYEKFATMYLWDVNQIKKTVCLNKDPLVQQIFEYLSNQIIYSTIVPIKSHNHSKVSTIIVRKALDNLIFQEGVLSKKKPQRMTKQNRQKYDTFSIPLPSSRMNIKYLRTVFAIEKVRIFYSSFIKQNLLQELQKDNYESIYRLQQIIKNTVQQNLQIDLVIKCKKPFSLCQIKQFVIEAKNIEQKFCY